MSKAKPDPKKLASIILDPKKPVPVRAFTFVNAVKSSDAPAAMDLVTVLLDGLKANSTAVEAEQLKEMFGQAMDELKQGGLRRAAYIGPIELNLPGMRPRVHVVTHDGQHRFPFLAPGVEIKDLRRGVTTFLDGKGTVVLGHTDQVPLAGPQATFQRQLPGSQEVEVSIRDETATFYASSELLDCIAKQDIKQGDKVLISPQQELAFYKVPHDDDRRSRFVDRSKIPDVLAGRDIGRPHSCLSWLVSRTRTLMFRQDLTERFDQRPRVSLLMVGPSGTGKTLTIKAYLNKFRQMTVERTGRDDLESRVIRVKLSEQLSEWLGRSEKNWDALFDDIIYLASKPVATADGQRILLPVIVCLEEIDAAARRRSDGLSDASGGVMDRIMGTILQRFDDAVDVISHLPVVFISTSNRGEMIDGAMFRRLGTKIARFKRLDREGLAAVLDKKVKPSYPFAATNGSTQAQLRQQLIDDVVADLFSPLNDQVANLELTLGDGSKLARRPRDFLTGAVVEQALSEAIDNLVIFAERTGRDDVGLDGKILVAALRGQIDNLVQNISKMNVADYVDVPEHTYVASVSRPKRLNGQLGHLTGGHR